MTKNIIDDFIKIENAAHDGAFGDNLRAIPTDAQAIAGNYKLGRVTVYGLSIAIEQPRNSYRTGIDQKTGKRWTNRMAAHYGYFSGTKGADGDGVDCFIGFYPQSEHIYIINQFVNGSFDEHKVCLAFPDEQTAKNAYLNSYDKGWNGLHSIITASITQLKWWLKNGNMKNPIALNHLPYEGLSTMNQKVTWDSTATPQGITLDKLLYEIKRADGGNNLIFDAISMQDILEDADSVITFDALVTPYAQLDRKMTTLKNVMNRSGGQITVAVLQISDPFKQSGVAQVAAVFELSDGQTVSIFFHNPDIDPRKIQQGDELISWKWLLNKKDITIVVAPEKGVDLNIMNVAQRIIKLAEKNSPAFIRANSKRAEKMQAIEDLKTEIVTLEQELKDVLHELEVAKVEAEDRAASPPKIDNELNPANPDDLAKTPEEFATDVDKNAMGEAAERKAEVEKIEAFKQAILQALIDNFGWKNQSTVGGPLFWVTKEIGGGDKGGMVNPEGIRRVSAKFDEGSMIAMHGDNVVARSPVDESKTPEQNAGELDRAVNAIDPNYVNAEPEVTLDPEVIPETETITKVEQESNEQENQQAEVAPPAETSGAEGDLTPSKSFDEYAAESDGNLYKAANNYFKAELKGKVVKTVIGDVHIIGGTWQEMKSHMNKDAIKARLIEHIVDILKSGVYFGKEDLNKERHDNFIAFHFFEKDGIKVGEYTVDAGVTVAQRREGQLEFDLSAYGLGHGDEPRWKKRKGEAVVSGQKPEIVSPIEPDKPALDSTIGSSDLDVNIVLLKVFDKDGNEIVELEDDVDQEGYELAQGDAEVELLQGEADNEDNLNEDEVFEREDNLSVYEKWLNEFKNQHQFQKPIDVEEGNQYDPEKDPLESFTDTAFLVEQAVKEYGGRVQWGNFDATAYNGSVFDSVINPGSIVGQIADKNSNVVARVRIEENGVLTVFSGATGIDKVAEPSAAVDKINGAIDAVFGGVENKLANESAPHERDAKLVQYADEFGRGKEGFVGAELGDLEESLTSEQAAYPMWGFSVIQGTIQAQFALGSGQYAGGDRMSTPEDAYSSMINREAWKALSGENVENHPAGAQENTADQELMNKLFDGYGYPGGESMPDGLKKTALKLYQAIIDRDVNAVVPMLHPDNKLTRKAFEYLFDGKLKLPRAIKGVLQIVEDFFSSVNNAIESESGQKPEPEPIPSQDNNTMTAATEQSPLKSTFIAELEALKSETDIYAFNDRLDEIAARIEQSGLMEELDAELNSAADVLTDLLAVAENG